jgi:hypothetical protein
MSDAISKAIEAMEWMMVDYEHLNVIGDSLSANWVLRVQAVKDAIASLQAMQGDMPNIIIGDGSEIQMRPAVPDSVLRDAKRYQFLRGKIGYDSHGVNMPCGNTKIIAEETDAAIDKALLSAAKGEES